MSQTPSPKAVFEVSVSVGGDGHPVVAYVEYANATASQGAITVKRWTGSAWQLLSGAGGIGQGYAPHVRIAANGTTYVAWLRDDANGSTEIRLLARTAAGTTWDQVGASDSPGGIAGTDALITAPFSLALGADGNPMVAFPAFAQTGTIDVTDTPAVIDGTLQVYVRRWSGSAWEFVGSNFTGGGASNAVSFAVGATSFVHGADTPSLAVDSDGAPVVAFGYFTFVDGVESTNKDIYAARWDGAAWTAVGPAVPSGDSVPGQGGPSGVSDSAGGSFNPSLAPDAGGRLALAWGEESPAGDAYVWVRVWNGADAWEELAGSASGNGFTQPGSVNTLPQIAVDPDGRPIVAWEAWVDLDSIPQIFVLRWNDGIDAWEEMGLDSGSGSGISDAALEASAPMLALTPSGGTAAAGMPTVAWLDDRDPGSPQILLRQFFSGTTFPLTVTVTGDGMLTSNPIGVECSTGTCVTEFPTGTSVTLIPQGGQDGLFGSWAGACTGSAACTVAMTQTRSVTANFTAAHTLTVDVLSPGGRVSSSPAGIASCTDSCSKNYVEGTNVTLTATVNAGGTFTGWGGGVCSGTSPTCVVPVTTDRSVTASFSLLTYPLSVEVIGTNGQNGVARIGGPGLDCGVGDGTCIVDITYGTPVVLQANPEPGNRFLNWSGGPCAGRTTAICSFTMTATASTKALLRGITGVSVLKAGNGAGTVTGPGISCGVDCSQEVYLNSAVTLTPSPATGSTFIGWAGDVCDSQPSGACTFTASGVTRSVTASFQLKKHLLTVATTGLGFVTSPGGDIDCGGPDHTLCTFEYDYGTTVTLTPTAEVDSTFYSWTGCSSVSGQICTVKMTANRTITAKFVPAHTLSVEASGNGSGKITTTTPPGLTCVSDCSVSQVFRATATVTLTPAPAVGTNFHWVGGDCAGTGACSLTMGVTRSAIGQFTLNRHVLAVTNRPSGNVGSDALPDAFVYNCGNGNSACSDTLDYGTAVTLHATANAGFVFVNWTGVTCSGGSTNASCSFVLKGNTTATPNFRAKTIVSVTKQGTGAGTITSTGINCGTDCSQPMFDARAVTLRATPATGSHFVAFAGDCVSPTVTCTFVPAGNTQSVSATFTLNSHSLTVVNRLNGHVASPSIGVDCGTTDGATGSDCTATLDYGTQVTLQATPITGSRFVNWAGVTCLNGSTNATCTFALKGNITVTPTFRDVTAVSLSKIGQGTVVSSPAGISCGTSCAYDFARGALVKLTATPATGWSFTGWSGDPSCPGTGTCSFTASTPSTAVTATFTIQSRQLQATVSGDGSVTGTGGFSCDMGDSPCLQNFDYGTSVTLTATASPGFRFTGWSGACTGTGSCTLSMTANRSVTATFKPEFTLTVTMAGNSTGRITSAPAGIDCPSVACTKAYLTGTSVTLTRATPAVGTVFQWGGDCTFRGSASTCMLSMTAAHSITADFNTSP